MSQQSSINQFRAARSDSQLAVLEGLHVIKHALRFGANPTTIVVAEGVDVQSLANRLAPDVTDHVTAARTVPPSVFAQLAPVPPATGIMAIAPRRSHSLTDILDDPVSPPVVLLDYPQQANNIGAAIRVAAAAGAAGLIVRGEVDPWSPGALRAATGLHYALPVVQTVELSATDRPIIAIDAAAQTPVATAVPPRALLVFGAERDGIAPDLLARANHRWRLPMRAGVSSLNLATAVAAVLYGHSAPSPAGGALQ